MESPYSPPVEDGNENAGIARSKKVYGMLALFFGLTFCYLPLRGLIRMIDQLLGAFALAQQKDMGDPSELAEKIASSLLVVLWSVILSSPALIASIVFLVLYWKKRRILRSSKSLAK